MKLYILLLLCVFLSVISCGENVKFEQTFTVAKSNFYNGNYGTKGMIPKVLENRNYKIVDIQVKSGNTVTLDSVIITTENLKSSLDEKWAKIEEDEYKGVLVVRIGNDENTDYDFYHKIYQQIKSSFQEEKEQLSLKLFGVKLEGLSQNQLTQISALIPVIVNEKIPDNW